MSTPRSKRLVCIQRIYDFFLYSTAAIGLVISFTGLISPQNTYIRCDDPSISHDLQPDTISLSVLIIVSLLGPLMMMLTFEWGNLYQAQVESPHYKSIRRTWSFFLSLLAGALFALFVVEVLKTAVSEARPHFMTSCRPNLTEELCQKPWIHITKDNCSNPLNLNSVQIIDSMKSFPSGHAAIGVFSAVYMTMYIQRRVHVPWSILVVAWLQLVWWTWALLCCASRVWDNKHHWWDVAVGGIIGAVGGYSTVAYLCYWFEDYQEESQDIERLHDEEGRASSRQTTSTKEKDRNGHYGKQLEMEETISNHQRLLVE